MKSNLDRRSFLRRTLAGGAAISAAGLLPLPNLLASENKGDRLKVVQIGCGGRAKSHLDWIINESKDLLLAIVDPDETRHATIKPLFQQPGTKPEKVALFTDYRVMFDKIGKQADAFIIATPNHHHALPSIMAMQLGKGVYCEKPLCHDIAEARKLRTIAAAAKGPTQMGNQGHCEDGYRRLCEFVWAGVVGKITETHSWTDRANGGVGPRPPVLPVPAGLHWDEWIGPAPYREFHADLHPHEWHGWYDFGNGSLGNMGCHVLDGVYWALQLEHPVSVEAEEIREGSDERYPTGSRIRWDFPARGEMPAVKVFWYEGLRKDAREEASGSLRTAKGGAQNLPPLIEDLKKRYPDEEFDTNGTLYVGEKGVLYTGTYGGRMHILPFERMQQMKQPPRTMARPKNIMTDFLDACRTGKKETAASFDYGARLTEFTLLGNLAQHAGVGKKVLWDGPGMRVTSRPWLERWVKAPYRKGWTST